MDAKQQAEGEKLVDELLIQPLLNRGLAKPASLNTDRFKLMLAGLRQKLAYMSADSLAVLEEMAAKHPSGSQRDRFPIANSIYDLALEVAPPPDDASPFIRAVFAHGVGRDAIAEGWAPELLAFVRGNRGTWPGSYTQQTMRDMAREAIRRAQRLKDQLARDGELSRGDAAWLAARRATIQKCEWIRELGLKGAGQ